MSFASRISRAPRAYDPERGSHALEGLGGLETGAAELVAGAAGCSPYLHRLLGQEAEWVPSMLEAEPETALDDLLSMLPALEHEGVARGLRLAKRRVALLAALADLGGVWSLEEVTGALTRLADAATGRALAAALEVERRRGRLSEESEAQGLAVFAMGKMGAFELNYSSDIDLICLFDEAQHPPAEFAERRAALVRATRRLAALLGDLTEDGYVFRTDLRLRPDPAVTPVCLSMDAAERYYEALGRTWERAVWIKARACAGDLAAGQDFLERLRPFVWRRHLDFPAIQDAHDMRLRIRDHRALHGAELERRNVKLGRGGIREIEFFTQTRQIIAGGRDPSLRVRGTLDALARLVAAGWAAAEDARALAEDYRYLRGIEHRLQMINDAQTHALPGDAQGFDRLAALCGCTAAELRGELEQRMERVAEITEGFFAPHEAGGTGTLSPEQRAVITGWRSFPALRSPRSIELFDRLAPRLFEKLGRTSDPEAALRHLEAFLSRLPAGVQVLSLFDANDQLLDLVVDIADSAPELARYLGSNAGVLDAVIGGTFFEPWPGAAALGDELSRHLEAAADYEAQLDAARRWQKEWHFRIGVHLLRGLVDPLEAGRSYAELAEATLATVWPAVVAEFARSHGAPPGRGATVLGMGSLGAGLLTAASDLDLIVIYDPGDAVQSEGRRPLAVRAYYARLTQALVTALSAPTAAGRLYQVDMRLRPSGRQGPVATSFPAFQSYQREEAWTWEHLALTRARPIAGEAALGSEAAAFLRDLLEPPRPAGPVLQDTADMRRRLFQARRKVQPWEAKAGPGRLQDIELVSSSSALIGEGLPTDMRARLASGGLLAGPACDRVAAAHDLFWSVQSAARLLSGEALTDATAKAALTRRVTGCDEPDALAERIARTAEETAELFDRLLPEVDAEAED